MKYNEYENWGRFSRLEICDGWKALAIGCGEGYELAYLRSLGVEAYGLDDGSQDRQLPHENFFIADAREIPCKNDSFDLVLCLGVIQHVPESIRLLKEIRQVLKEEGKFVITATNKHGITLKRLRTAFRKVFGLKTFEYEKFYGHKELTNLLKNSGFKIDKMYTTRFIPYRVRLYPNFEEFIIGILFWFEKKMFQKILKNFGTEIVIYCRKS